MRLQTDEDFIKYDIHLARWLLIKARIARQKATIAKEMALKEGHTDFLLKWAQETLDEATELRKDAQALLRNVERANGERYLANEPVFALKDYLKGKFFRAWKEFDAEYAKLGSPFYGKDPE